MLTKWTGGRGELRQKGGGTVCILILGTVQYLGTV
jgi:hypothetical protein